MSIINTLTRGLIYKEGEQAVANRTGGWSKGKNSHYWFSNRLSELWGVYIPLFPVWLLSLFTNWGKKVIGRALGFSSCSHCGMPWKYVEGESIQFSGTEGMFPLCTSCFAQLTPEEIDLYIEQLVQDWVSLDTKYGIPWGKKQTPDEVIASAKQKVLAMKAPNIIIKGISSQAI